MEEANSLKNKPSSSAFKQQKLPAWQPILTAGTVLPTFFLIGIAFVPIGFGLLMTSRQVQEKAIDYTHCMSIIRNETCARMIDVYNETSCTCTLDIILPENFTRDVFVYYGLSNFYQNHRRYVKSRDDKQLLGVKGSLSRDCDPFKTRTIDGKQLPIAPCGAIANSMFNDTFSLTKVNDVTRNTEYDVKLLRTGIAWATDKNSKFKNPSGEPLKQAFEGYTNPPNWGNRTVYMLDEKDATNNGYLNEPLIVWMRTAALPTFRKIYARVDHRTHEMLKSSLPKGLYVLTVHYNFPVASFKGTKTFIISNTSWLGGKNPFLGIAYMIVGCLCLLLSAVFLFIHKKFGKSTSDLINVSQRTPYLNS